MNKKLVTWSGLIFLGAIVLASFITVLILLLRKVNTNIEIPTLPEHNNTQGNNYCNDCQFLNHEESCIPTEQQKISASDCDNYSLSNICYPSMKEIALNCLNLSREYCTDNQFLNILDTSCGSNPLYNDDFSKQINFGTYCNCIPTNEHINCTKNNCNNLRSSDYPICTDCEFLSGVINSQCINEVNVTESCGCELSPLQLSAVQYAKSNCLSPESKIDISLCMDNEQITNIVNNCKES